MNGRLFSFSQLLIAQYTSCVIKVVVCDSGTVRSFNSEEETLFPFFDSIHRSRDIDRFSHQPMRWAVGGPAFFSHSAPCQGSAPDWPDTRSAISQWRSVRRKNGKGLFWSELHDLFAPRVLRRYSQIFCWEIFIFFNLLYHSLQFLRVFLFLNNFDAPSF